MSAKAPTEPPLEPEIVDILLDGIIHPSPGADVADAVARLLICLRESKPRESIINQLLGGCWTRTALSVQTFDLYVRDLIGEPKAFDRMALLRTALDPGKEVVCR